MRSFRAATAIFCLIWPAATTSGQDAPELTKYFRSIRVEAGQTTSDAMCFMCPIYARGKIDGDALTLGGDIIVEGEITGDALVLGGKLVLLGNSKIDGDAVAIGGEVQKEAGASLAGESDSIPYFHFPGQRSFHPLGVLTFFVANMLFLVLLGYVIPRRRSANLAAAIHSHPVSTAVAGILFACLFVFLVIFAKMPTRSGTWISVLITFAALFLLVYGYLGVALLAGKVMGGSSRLITLLTGAALVTMALLIPLVGMATLAAILVLAPGCVLVSGLGRDSAWLVHGLRRGKVTAPPAA